MADFALPLMCGLAVYCACGGHRYQSGDGFSEMLSIEGLKTLRLRLVNPPQRLYFAKGFSKLTGLTAVHLRRHRTHWPDNAPFRPTFSAFPFPQPLHSPGQVPAYTTCPALVLQQFLIPICGYIL